MDYEASLKRLPNFLRYINKVYKFSETIDTMEDSRQTAEVSSQTIFMSVFLCMLLGLGSLRQLAKDANSGKLRKFLPKRRGDTKETYCCNTIANGLENIDTSILQKELSVVPKKLRRNKSYGSSEHPRTIGGFRIVAVDGTEHFRSESLHCPECMEVHVRIKEGVKTQYVHNIVIMYVVGRMHPSAVQVILGAEPALPKDTAQGEKAGHEGEATAAKRLIQKMIDLYGNNFFDIITTDAYYATMPFVLFLDSLGKYLVSRVRKECTTLYQEIQELSQIVVPIYIDDRENRVESWIYEIPALQTCLTWDVPTRGFKIVEKAYKIVSGQKIYINEETFLCMSTLPEDMADANVIRQIVHAKWGIENNAIKDLKDTGIWNTTFTTNQMPPMHCC